METFEYKVDIPTNAIKNEKDQQKFFSDGHPLFFIPDFCPSLCDIWISFMEYLEKKHGCEIYDQDGGEITKHKILNDSGLTECRYEAYGISINGEGSVDYVVNIEGYIIDSEKASPFFMATKVSIHEGL